MSHHLPLLIAAGTSSLLVALAVVHGIVSAAMLARGLGSWTVGDSIGAGLLVGIGAAVFVSSVVLVAAVWVSASVTPTELIVAGAGIIAGALWLRLGVLALGKLFR